MNIYMHSAQAQYHFSFTDWLSIGHHDVIVKLAIYKWKYMYIQ